MCPTLTLSIAIAPGTRTSSAKLHASLVAVCNPLSSVYLMQGKWMHCMCSDVAFGAFVKLYPKVVLRKRRGTAKTNATSEWTLRGSVDNLPGLPINIESNRHKNAGEQGMCHTPSGLTRPMVVQQ